MPEANASTPREARPVLRSLAWIAIALVVTAYLGQHWRLRPTETDDGLLLEYIHQMARGALPFWDVVDLYGPFNWVFPVPFYVLSGHKVWAIHLWVLILKVLSVWASYKVVSALTARFYGALSAFFLTILLGQGWQPLQTPYASFTVLPLLFGTWHMLLTRPFQREWLNPALAALFTTLTIWTKLNTGIYLFAAGLFALFCFIPPRDAPALEASSGEAGSPALGRWLTRLRVLAVIVYAVFWIRYLREFFELLYFVYLVVPLLMVLGFALVLALKQPASSVEARRVLKSFGIYLGVTLGLSLAILLGYYRGGALLYIREIAGIVSMMSYRYPFPPVGAKWFFVGYNEFFWPQLPWLLTLCFGAWLVMQRRAGERAWGADWPRRRAQVGAVLMFTTLYSFVLYPRSDDMHIFQALLLVMPGLCFTFFHLERLVRAARPKFASYGRPALAVVSVVYSSTLFEMPSLDDYSLRPGDFGNPRLEYIDYRPDHNPKIRSFAPHIKDREWDVMVDEAARYIDDITEENEPVFVFCDVRFLNFASRTVAVGGRYVYYIYLISVGLLDRAGFDKIAPPTVVPDIMANPPRVIVTRGDNEAFVPQFPELREFRDRYYDKTRTFGYIQIFERKPFAESAIQGGAAQPGAANVSPPQ